jgi:hypothetical protein
VVEVVGVEVVVVVAETRLVPRGTGKSCKGAGQACMYSRIHLAKTELMSSDGCPARPRPSNYVEMPGQPVYSPSRRVVVRYAVPWRR